MERVGPQATADHHDGQYNHEREHANDPGLGASHVERDGAEKHEDGAHSRQRGQHSRDVREPWQHQTDRRKQLEPSDDTGAWFGDILGPGELVRSLAMGTRM